MMILNFGAFQRAVWEWVVKAFGVESADDTTERAYRFSEEALECVQAAGMSKEDVLRMVDYVYTRKAGTLPQEVAGVLTTLAALANAHSIAMDDVAATELVRVHVKMDEIRGKQLEKIQSPAIVSRRVRASPATIEWWCPHCNSSHAFGVTCPQSGNVNIQTAAPHELPNRKP